jgi:hypothetical protein
MEETVIEQTHIPSEPQGLLLLPDAQEFLLETGKWSRFLGIVGYIGAGLMVLFGLFFSTFMSALSHLQTAAAPRFMGGFFGFFYLLIGLFYFFVSRYLHQFGTRIKDSIHASDPAEVSIAFDKLKSLFKLTGVTTIVIIALYALIIVAIIIGAAIGFSMIKHG